MVLWRNNKNDTRVASAGSRIWAGGSVSGEETWQMQARRFDSDNVALLGFSLDMVANVASSAEFYLSFGGKVLDDPIHVNKLMSYRNGFKQSFPELVYSAVRALALVGEFDLVRHDKYGWAIFFAYQRKRTITIDNVEYIEYALSESGSVNADVLQIPQSEVKRVVFPKHGMPFEAYSPVKRILPLLEAYQNLLASLNQQAKNNKTFGKLLYLGEDDGRWQNNTIVEDGGQRKDVPPVIADAVELGKKIRDGETDAPFFPMMGAVKPVVIDMSTSIDGSVIDAMRFLQEQIAQGLNIPSRLLTGESGNHWSDWLLDAQFKQYGVEPLLNVALKGISDFADSMYKGCSLGYRFVDKSSVDVAQALDAYRSGVVGSEFVRNTMDATDEDAPTEEDIGRVENLNKSKTDSTDRILPNG